MALVLTETMRLGSTEALGWRMLGRGGLVLQEEPLLLAVAVDRAMVQMGRMAQGLTQVLVSAGCTTGIGGGGGGAGGRAGRSGVHVVLKAPSITINGTIITLGNKWR